MNDMFDNLKILKQKIQTDENQKIEAKKVSKAKTSNLTGTISDKESRLKKEFKEFMKEADI